jgi:transcriptional regulator with XRE-family HTH domain
MAPRRTTKPPSDAPFGAVVAYFRHRRDLTGAELGGLLRWSQPKVSKIETGAVVPSHADVERLIQVLSVSPAEAKSLRELADRSRNQMTDWRAGHHNTADWQRDIARLENQATELRVFQPAMLIGLLQTSETARSILEDVQRTWTHNTDSKAVAKAVTARVQRQEILEDSSKRFVFVMPEAVLHALVAQGEDVSAQLKRIQDISRRPNVEIRILAEGTRWPVPPTNGFYLLDDKYVVIDLLNTIVVARGRADVDLYQQAFDAISDAATPDIDPILERYRAM